MMNDSDDTDLNQLTNNSGGIRMRNQFSTAFSISIFLDIEEKKNTEHG